MERPNFSGDPVDELVGHFTVQPIKDCDLLDTGLVLERLPGKAKSSETLGKVAVVLAVDVAVLNESFGSELKTLSDSDGGGKVLHFGENLIIILQI